MKSKILLVTNIFAITIILMNLFFGITHKYMIINVLMLILFITIVVITFKNSKNIKSNGCKILSIILTTVLLLLTLYKIVIVVLLGVVGGPMETMSEYKFSNNKELLKNVYYADITPINPPIQVVYERKFLFGIKCSIIIKSNSDNTNAFELDEVYKEIQEQKNTGLCHYKLKVE